MKSAKKSIFLTAAIAAAAVLAVTAFVPAAMAVSDALPSGLATTANENTDYVYTSSTNILEALNDITITGTGTFTTPIILEIGTGATITWQATTGTTSGTDDLITISEDSADDGTFIVELGGGSLEHEGSVLVNESEAAIEISSGTLSTTGAGLITLYSKGNVRIDSTGTGIVAIQSVGGPAVFVEDADIDITGDTSNQLTIGTMAESYSAIYSKGDGNITVTGASGNAHTTSITVSGGDNAAIYNENGDVTINHATIEVHHAGSSAVNALEGTVMINGDTLISVQGDNSAGVYAHNGVVTVEGNAQIIADGEGGVAVYSAHGDVALGGTVMLTAIDGGPVVEARGGGVTVGQSVMVNAGSASGIAIRASGDITVDPANTAGIMGTKVPNYDYDPDVPTSSSGCDAGFGFGALVPLAGAALILRRKRR
jgi:hypothetical protein